MIQDWINNGCNYQEGVILLEKLSSNKVLIQLLKKGSSPYLQSKLKAELIKLKSVEVQKSIPEIPSEETPSDKLKEIKSKPISFYPASLHPVYQRRISTFLEACSLKVQLNEIENNQEEAFKIQFKIFNLFLENDKCWKVLKQFEDHGQILPFESSEDFSNLSYTALCKLRQNKYTSVSKRKKTIAEWKAELPSLPLKKRGQKELNILEKEKELQRFLNDIEKLSNLINEKE